MCVHRHRKGPGCMPTKPLIVTSCGWETHSFTYHTLVLLHILQRAGVNFTTKKPQGRNNNSCHLLSMEYKPGTRLGPSHTSPHFILPVALACKTIMKTQIGKLSLKEDIQLESGRAGIQTRDYLTRKPYADYPYDAHALSREKGVRLPWECRLFILSCFTAEKVCQLQCIELRHLGVSAA